MYSLLLRLEARRIGLGGTAIRGRARIGGRRLRSIPIGSLGRLLIRRRIAIHTRLRKIGCRALHGPRPLGRDRRFRLDNRRGRRCFFPGRSHRRVFA